MTACGSVPVLPAAVDTRDVCCLNSIFTGAGLAVKKMELEWVIMKNYSVHVYQFSQYNQLLNTLAFTSNFRSAAKEKTKKKKSAKIIAELHQLNKEKEHILKNIHMSDTQKKVELQAIDEKEEQVCLSSK